MHRPEALPFRSPRLRLGLLVGLLVGLGVTACLPERGDGGDPSGDTGTTTGAPSTTSDPGATSEGGSGSTTTVGEDTGASTLLTSTGATSSSDSGDMTGGETSGGVDCLPPNAQCEPAADACCAGTRCIEYTVYDWPRCRTPEPAGTS